MKVESTDFENGKRLPDRFAFDHQNQSPALSWTEVPEGTKELALICDDPDAPMGTWVHWVLYRIPANVTRLEAGIPKQPTLAQLGGAKQGQNGFRQTGYDGPRPPAGPVHRYYFKLYALSEALDLKPGANAAALQRAMKGKVLAEAQIMGTYSR